MESRNNSIVGFSRWSVHMWISARKIEYGVHRILELGLHLHQPLDIWLGVVELNQDFFLKTLDHMQKLQKSLNNVHEQHFNATQRQKRLLDPRAQQHSCKVGGPGLCKRQHKKEQFLPQVRSPLERPIYSHSQLWPRVIWDPDSAWKKIMHHNQLKLYVSDGIPARVRRQRHRVVTRSHPPTQCTTAPVYWAQQWWWVRWNRGKSSEDTCHKRQAFGFAARRLRQAATGCNRLQQALH